MLSTLLEICSADQKIAPFFTVYSFDPDAGNGHSTCYNVIMISAAAT